MHGNLIWQPDVSEGKGGLTIPAGAQPEVIPLLPPQCLRLRERT